MRRLRPDAGFAAQCAYRNAARACHHNVSAVPVDDPNVLRADLIKQITHSVRWTESMGSLVNADIDPAVEVGPGSVLKGLMRRIARGVTVLGAGTVDNIEQTAAQLMGEN